MQDSLTEEESEKLVTNAMNEWGFGGQEIVVGLEGFSQLHYCRDCLPDWYLKSFQAKIRSGGTRIAAQNVSRVK
ncbi:hypothetical protein [Flexithrix dorotheae]|uniref:hypothetical protein n=1 Tax=Flexithrix dorotheae TaxID=70993 RepID=UPI00035C5CC2|nr:hypothetical protein [Flexithrix dorotheae]